MRVSQYLLNKFVNNSGNTANPQVRTKIGYLAAWVSIVSNTFLALAKAVLGLRLNSISLLADAVHTASDVITSVVVLAGFKAASLPADEEHPYGHGRAETVATLVIAILLALAGLEFANRSLQRLFSGEAATGSLLVAGFLVAGGLFKEWLARFALELGRKIDSPALAADAWHHRSDAVASLLVAVSMVASGYGYHRVDAVLGMLVSVLIVYTGWELGWGAANTLLGQKPDPATIERITCLVSGIDGVEGIHKINYHDYGGEQKLVSLHIQVDEHLQVRESHAIAARVKYTLLADIGVRTTVHVEPCEAAGDDQLV